MNPTLSDVFEAVKQHYRSCSGSDPEGQAQLDRMAGLLQAEWETRERYVTDPARICLDRYVSAELDFVTPGLRGIGRIGEHIPRLGAKHRSAFANASYDALAAIEYALKLHILNGYLFLEFIRRLPVQQSMRYDSGRLFDAWIGRVYSPPAAIEPVDQTELDLTSVWFQATAKQIHDRCVDIGIDWGFRDDVGTDQAIVTHYWDAGTALRYTESELGG